MATEINKSPLISVIIPCFNSGKFIEDTLNSVLNQSYQNLEIIVVDDGSSDNTLVIIQKMAGIDNRIKYFQIQHSGRPSVPRNYGIKKASGSLMAFLDSDDLWTKEKLFCQVKYLNDNPGANFVYSMSISYGNVNVFSENFELFPLPFRIAHNREELIKKGNTIPVSTVLIRKEVLEDGGGFDESPDLKAVEDYDLWLRLGGKYEFNFIPRIHLYYRIHAGQFSADWDIKQERLKILAKKNNIPVPEYKYLRRRGIGILVIRNFIHLLYYTYFRIIGYAENKDKLAI